MIMIDLLCCFWLILVPDAVPAIFGSSRARPRGKKRQFFDEIRHSA